MTCHTLITMRKNANHVLHIPGHVTLWCLEVVPVAYTSDVIPRQNMIELACMHASIMDIVVVVPWTEHYMAVKIISFTTYGLHACVPDCKWSWLIALWESCHFIVLLSRYNWLTDGNVHIMRLQDKI